MSKKKGTKQKTAKIHLLAPKDIAAIAAAAASRAHPNRPRFGTLQLTATNKSACGNKLTASTSSQFSDQSPLLAVSSRKDEICVLETDEDDDEGFADTQNSTQTILATPKSDSGTQSKIPAGTQ